MVQLDDYYDGLSKKILWANGNMQLLDAKLLSVKSPKVLDAYKRLLTYKKDCNIVCRKIQLLNSKNSQEDQEDSKIANKARLLMTKEYSNLKCFLDFVI